MMVNGRHAMVERAIRSFEAQTYENRRMYFFDTTPENETWEPYFGTLENPVTHCVLACEHRSKTVGMLRNEANGYCSEDIIVHWDSDDYSHPNRIAEQVALLQSSGKDCVGYRDMLFWDETPGQFCGAWMYQNGNHKFCLGTSLCYWRRVWERHPFPDLPKGPQSAGEDTVWLDGVTRYGYHPVTSMDDDVRPEPRMIASIHGGNTTSFWLNHRDREPMFRRAPEWDEYCRERMKL
jgi:hypothetical protein